MREELRETLECSQAETLRLEKSQEICERAKAELAAQVDDLLRTDTHRFKCVTDTFKFAHASNFLLSAYRYRD